MPKNDPEYERGYTDGFNAGTGFQAELTPPSDAEQLVELRKAMLLIEQSDPACNCEHDTEYCCAVVKEFCARCWAHVALNPSHARKET